MRTRVTAVTAILIFAITTPVRAQDAGKIVGQYIKAQGGSKALTSIRTLTIEGMLTNEADTEQGTYTLVTKFPNRYYSELIVRSQSIIEAYNGKSAWHRNEAGEIASLLGPEAVQLEAAGQYYCTHLLNARKSKIGMGFVGHTSVRGRDALQIEVTTPSGVKRELFFDPQSHLIVKEAATMGGIDQEILYDDYRNVEGIKLPYKLELHRGKDVYNIVVTRAVVNGAVGERVFDFPKKAQIQLPDLKALFKEILENQKAVDKLKENYAGTRTVEETEYDKAGKATKREAHEYTFFYLDGHPISTLVKKNGAPLSEDEQKKENEKTQKRIEEHQNRHAKKEAKEEKAKETGKEKKEKGDVSIETFLRACQFVNPRRERFRGQDVLVFDFEPNPDFKPHDVIEKVIQKLAGVIWIDEKAHDVVRLEAYFVGDFKYGGGLIANVHKGTSFAFEQAFINNEVWLPTYEEAHVGLRVLMLKGIKINEVTRYSDYRKFNVESLGVIGKPKAVTEAPSDPSATPSKPD
jgi:hypothetical protein